MTYELKALIAWSLKNMFMVFWRHATPDSGKFFFNYKNDAILEL